MEFTDSNLLIRNRSGNQPSEAELVFITRYLKGQLQSLETQVSCEVQSTQLITTMARVSSIESSIKDLISPDGGNYRGLLVHLNHHLNSEERLADLRTKCLAILKERGIQADKFKKIVKIPTPDPHAGYYLFNLDEYLEKLERTIVPTQVPASCQPELIKNQLARTTEILLDYLAYLISNDGPGICNQTIEMSDQSPKQANSSDQKHLVFLLRDTLLLYLGARRLQSAGKAIDAKGALISRALIQYFAPNFPNNPIYAGLYNSIYTVLSTYEGTFSAVYVDLYADVVRQTNLPAVTDLLHFIKQYLSRLCGEKSGYLAVDNAAHGTMPLLAMTASNVVKAFQMYTGVPWLQEFYGDVIYCPGFPDMRMLESLVCQEELFRFKAISGDRIIIEETNDPIIKEHAAYEIGYFFNAVDARFLQ